MRRLGSIVFGVCAALLCSSASGAESTFCLGRQATIVDRLGGGSVKGTSTADVIVASGGDQVVDGRGGNDRICTGLGSDRIVGGAGNDRIDAGGRADHLEGGNGERQAGFD